MSRLLEVLSVCLLISISSLAMPMLELASKDISATPQCSTNASAAWVDVILLIDTSINMGSSNLRKIATLASLALSKFSIGNQADIMKGQHNTRVAVVTYDHVARVVANFTSINSMNDLNSVLNRISVSSSSDANIYDAFMQSGNLFYETMDVQVQIDNNRPKAYVVFAASTKTPVINQYVTQIAPQNVGAGSPSSTVITINFNTADAALTNTLNQLSLNPYANATMYNFASTSNTLTADLSWAILQANCFCQVEEGIPLVMFDKSNNRYSRYAQCMVLAGSGDPTEGIDNSVPQICADYNLTPASILSADQGNFVQNVWVSEEEDSAPYYIGLHKNSQSQWVWYDYNLTDFSASYFNWAPGYPQNNGNCAVLNYANDGTSFVWQNADCEPQYTLNGLSLCQMRSCDAESVACGFVEVIILASDQENIQRRPAHEKPSKRLHKISQTNSNKKIVRKH